MSDKQQMIPVVGLLTTIMASVYMVVQLNAQTTPSRNFTTATLAEVRDAQGGTILSGQFQQADEDDDDIERKATLAASGAGSNATGEAEVEFSPTDPAQQEVEFSVDNVSPGAKLTFLIDGIVVGTATADSGGEAELEVDVAIPGTAATR